MVWRRSSQGGECMPPEEVRVVSNTAQSSGDSAEVAVSRGGGGSNGGSTVQLRHGAAADRGHRISMEDCHVGVAEFELPPDSRLPHGYPDTRAFYGVFDGHGGVTAAEFASQNLLDFTLTEAAFPASLSEALRSSFLRVDQEFYAEVRSGRLGASGSTALAALVWGDQLLVANAGDSRAVLCRAGKALELSTDHKPEFPAEKARILGAGGAVCEDGRLNGELTVARSIGDFHLHQLKVAPSGALDGPLTAEPEVQTHTLQEDDEFLILGCDGVWDVLSSQRAVDIARANLRQFDDPTECSKALVEHALRLHTTDNVSVVTVCFREVPPRRTPPPTADNGRPRITMGRTLSREGLTALNDAMVNSCRLQHIPEQATVQLSGL